LSQSVIPTCFKLTTIVPVPKNSKVTCLNYYSPVALTSVIKKCFKRLVKKHINTTLLDTLDSLQFAYRPHRSTNDTIAIAHHTALFHLGKRENNYVRMLFIDYRSAFNTVVPSKLTTKLGTLGLNTSLCNWILDFLTGVPQVGRVGHIQGCGGAFRSVELSGAFRAVLVPDSIIPCHLPQNIKTYCILHQLISV
jgi:hypothetical protein